MELEPGRVRCWRPVILSDVGWWTAQPLGVSELCLRFCSSQLTGGIYEVTDHPQLAATTFSTSSMPVIPGIGSQVCERLPISGSRRSLEGVGGAESTFTFQVPPHLALGVSLLDRFAFVALLPAAHESELDLNAVATSIQ